MISAYLIDKGNSNQLLKNPKLCKYGLVSATQFYYMIKSLKFAENVFGDSLTRATLYIRYVSVLTVETPEYS